MCSSDLAGTWYPDAPETENEDEESALAEINTYLTRIPFLILPGNKLHIFSSIYTSFKRLPAGMTERGLASTLIMQSLAVFWNWNKKVTAWLEF